MNILFSHLIVQFRQFYKNLTPVKRLSIVAATTISVVAIAVIILMVAGTNNVPLFTNVPPDQLPQVVDQLQKRGIPFKLSDNGATILIAKELLHSTEMAIMTELGSSKVGHVGLELFDKQDFGTTSY